jgi:hypothetical protein
LLNSEKRARADINVSCSFPPTTHSHILPLKQWLIVWNTHRPREPSAKVSCRLRLTQNEPISTLRVRRFINRVFQHRSSIGPKPCSGNIFLFDCFYFMTTDKLALSCRHRDNERRVEAWHRRRLPGKHVLVSLPLHFSRQSHFIWPPLRIFSLVSVSVPH